MNMSEGLFCTGNTDIRDHLQKGFERVTETPFTSVLCSLSDQQMLIRGLNGTEKKESQSFWRLQIA